MTVMVTGASGPIGHALVRLLVPKDEVRAAVRRADAAPALRALGAKVTVGRLDDVDALAEVLARVETVIHLVGGPQQPDADALRDANHGSAVRALRAAQVAGVPRFVLISVPGASPDASDPYLRARGAAEEAVVHSGLQHAVIRSTHAVGIGSLWFAAVVAGASCEPPLAIGGDAPVAPVAVADVAAVLAAADDRAGELAGLWALEGPDVLTSHEMIRLLAGADAPAPRSVTGERAGAGLRRLLGVEVPAPAIAWLAQAARADAPDAAAAFGVERTLFVEAVRGALEQAASAAE